jgi:hypothetical protein
VWRDGQSPYLEAQNLNNIEGGVEDSLARIAALRAELDALEADALRRTDKGAAGGVAPLDAAGQIPSIHLPPLATTEVYVVGSQAEMLALNCQRGDEAIRTDVNQTFILAQDPPSTLANWILRRTPADAVTSVNGKTGVVALSASDVGAAPESHVGAGGSAHAAAAAGGAAGFLSGSDKAKLDAIGIRELVLIPGGNGQYFLNNVSVGTGGVLTPDLRTGGVPADAKGVYVVVYAGSQTANLKLGVDSADVAAGTQTSPRVILYTIISAVPVLVQLGTGTNAGRLRLWTLSGTATSVYAWVIGYWR